MLDETPPQGQEAIERFLLETLPALGPPPRGAEGLARAARFFAACGNPQNRARQIHVVGTAGKGTAGAAIIGRLVGAGLSVGAHLSPHVYDLRERFLLDGQLPSWDAVGDALAALWPAMLETNEVDGRPPSFFEVTTAISWTVANQAGATYHVTEAGIGGRYDSTNTIAGSDKITVVTPIGFDHTEMLGDTIIEIAQNKADVIAASSLVIVGRQPHVDALHVVRSTAEARGARVIEVGEATMTFAEQADAVAEAVATAVAERERLAPPLDQTRAPVHLPGRLEAVPATAGRVVVLDGAHNPLKLRGLRNSMAAPPAVVVASLSAEKDLHACAAEIANLADVIITCQFAVTAAGRVVRRSWPSPELAAALRKARPECEVHESTDVEAAIAYALEVTKPGQTILATGSFMMIGPARDAVLL